MSSEANLLALPYEVREQIFQLYFKVDGGYVYDGESEKLVTADGQRIDLSLMYTCRSVADGTKHIPLSVNTVTFSTVYREDWRERAGGLAFVLEFHRGLQVDMIYCLAGLMTPDMYSQLGLRFPQSMPKIRRDLTDFAREFEGTSWHDERWFSFSSWTRDGLLLSYDGILRCHKSDEFYSTWGVTDASVSGAIAYTLRLLAEKHPAEFAQLIDKALPGWTDSHSPDEFFHLTFDPWAIPSLGHVVAAADQLQAHQLWDYLGKWHHDEEDQHAGNRCREKLSFSAAAVAVRFLDQLPEHRRLQVRNLIINEDRLAVGRPEGHMLGLIPFCRENPRLQVEQRVNLWRNLALRWELPGPHGALSRAERVQRGNDYRMDQANKLDRDRVNTALASWGFHVMEVMGEGMPAGTFSFVLDGDPDLGLSSDLFDKVVHPSVAVLKAHAECSSRGLLPQSRQHVLTMFPIPAAAYLRGIEPLLSGESFLRTNFNVGQPRDYKRLIETHKDRPFSAWEDEFYQIGRSFFVSSPALDLTKIILELFEQQRESDYLHPPSLNLCRREKKRLRRVRRRWACIEAGAEHDDTEARETMRILFGDDDAPKAAAAAAPCGSRQREIHQFWDLL